MRPLVVPVVQDVSLFGGSTHSGSAHVIECKIEGVHVLAEGSAEQRVTSAALRYRQAALLEGRHIVDPDEEPLHLGEEREEEDYVHNKLAVDQQHVQY